MALNIKNEHTVALARELAHLSGTSITSAIEDALEARLTELRAHPDRTSPTAAARLAAIREITDELHASLTDEDRERLRTAQHDLYDEYGLPR